MNKVWSYIISRQLNQEQLAELLTDGNHFVSSWSAHDNQLLASFGIYKERIILVHVNENVHQASGCSIDKLQRFIKDSEKKFGIELLNRLLVAYKSGENLKVTHSSNIKELLLNQELNANSIIYNTTVSSETELNNWEQSLKDTWLKKYLN